MRKKSDFVISQDASQDVFLSATLNGVIEACLPVSQIDHWLLLQNPKGKAHISVFLTSNEQFPFFVILLPKTMSGTISQTPSTFSSEDFVEKVKEVTKLNPNSAFDTFSEFQRQVFPSVEAHIKANEGYLFFFRNGLFWGFKKPLKFYHFSSTMDFHFTSVTSFSKHIEHASSVLHLLIRIFPDHQSNVQLALRK